MKKTEPFSSTVFVRVYFFFCLTTVIVSQVISVKHPLLEKCLKQWFSLKLVFIGSTTSSESVKTISHTTSELIRQWITWTFETSWIRWQILSLSSYLSSIDKLRFPVFNAGRWCFMVILFFSIRAQLGRDSLPQDYQDCTLRTDHELSAIPAQSQA